MAFRGTLQDIRLFVAAYEERSFTGAARRENSSQSGVSHHIRQLENLLDVALFVRDRNGVASTPAGDIFYRECVNVLRGFDEAHSRLSLYTRGFHGQFSIALSPAMAHRLVTPALLQFAALYPNVRVHVVECVPDQMPKLIKSGEVALALSAMHESDPGILSRQLLSAPECLVSRAHDTLPMPLRPINLVLPVLRERRRAAILDNLQAQGLTIGKIVEIDSALVILDLVNRSDWMTVAPCLIATPDGQDRLRLVPLRQPALIFKVVLLQPAAAVLPPGAAEFLDILRREAEENVSGWSNNYSTLGGS